MKETYKGYTIKIEQDESALDPRKEFNNLGIFLLSHRRYNVANETNIDLNDHKTPDSVLKAVEQEYGKCLILPVHMYDHSGVILNTTGFDCKWDSGQLGLIFVPYEKIRKEYSVKRVTKKTFAIVKDNLITEVETYGAYLNGDVYGYVIINASNEETDSCWGYYGCDHEKSGLMEAAKEIIDGYWENPTKAVKV